MSLNFVSGSSYWVASPSCPFFLRVCPFSLRERDVRPVVQLITVSPPPSRSNSPTNSISEAPSKFIAFQTYSWLAPYTAKDKYPITCKYRPQLFIPNTNQPHPTPPHSNPPPPSLPPNRPPTPPHPPIPSQRRFTKRRRSGCRDHQGGVDRWGGEEGREGGVETAEVCFGYLPLRKRGCADGIWWCLGYGWGRLM